MHTMVADPDLDNTDDQEPSVLRLLHHRPRTFATCLAFGLGTVVPCPFASCRHSLLADELRGEMFSDDTDLWERETCALAVAARRCHSKVEVAKISGHCESTTEEAMRRGFAKLLVGLGLDEYIRLHVTGELRFVRPKQRGCRPNKRELDGLGALVEALFKRGLPPLKTPPVRHLTKAQVTRIYGADRLHPQYGQPREERAVSKALGGAATAPAEQEAETLKETAAPVGSDSNRQNGDARKSDVAV